MKHTGGCLGKDQAGVDQVGDGEEDDEDRGGVGPDGLGAEEDVEGAEVEDGAQRRHDGGCEASNIELCVAQHVLHRLGEAGMRPQYLFGLCSHLIFQINKFGQYKQSNRYTFPIQMLSINPGLYLHRE